MSVLFTGATGFLGSRLLRELLTEESDEAITVLGRGAPDSLRDRVRTAVSGAGTQPLAPSAWDRLRYISADLTLPRLGLSAGDRARATKGVRTLWHCAGLVALLGDPAPVFKTNVLGTRGVLELADEAVGAHLLHISTAFVAGGRRSGHILETDLSEDEGFQTYYEESKYTAERAVHAWAQRNGRTVTVLRPSLLVDDRVTPQGLPGQPLDLLIQLIDGVLRDKGHEGDGDIHVEGMRFRLRGDSESAINLVPVEYAARAMVRIAARRSGAGVRTVHVTHPHNTSFETTLRAFEARYPGLKVSLTPTVTNPTPYESAAMQQASNLLAMGAHHRTYDRANLLQLVADLPDPPPINSQYLTRALTHPKPAP
ncbi:SDR family oxidoreductase [Streptomyces gobiensis]|uniref:SDR family oxidoreductase n=1 Tax=Streptomyces gobiensis TaxID=2875706 RepID=UPI001E6470AD|nr:SDR family oxidoreductase [Streptomyces gobiensis]UGY93249.1 SDR family oxidoreductase [Streptomyces gobiensis]